MEVDYRKTNPNLHKLYVNYAMEDLKIINEALEAFNSVSRINMKIIAGMIYGEKIKLIKESVAYQEALIRLETNQSPYEENDNDR